MISCAHGRRSILLYQWGNRGGGPHFALEVAKALAQRSDIDLFVSFSDVGMYTAEFRDIRAEQLPVKFDHRRPLGILREALRVRRRLRAWLRLHVGAEIWCCMSHPTDILAIDHLFSMSHKKVLVVHDGHMHLGAKHGWVRVLTFLAEWRADIIVVLSAHVGKTVAGRWPRKPVRSLWHPPFLDARQTSSSDVSATGRPIRFMFFGRIQRYKGLRLLLDACLLLRARGRLFELVVAGEGEIAREDWTILGELGADVRNHFLSDEEAGRLFVSVDWIILPYIEASQSGVIATAFGWHKPVICTPVGGLSEQVRMLRSGIISESVTAASLAESMNYVLDNPSAVTVSSLRTLEEVGWNSWAAKLLNGFSK